MKISFSSAALEKAPVDLLAVAVRSGKLDQDPLVKRLDKALGGGLIQQLDDEEFTGKAGELWKAPARGKLKARWLLLVGADADATPADVARFLGARAASSARGQRTIALLPPEETEEAIQACAEGLLLGAYKYTQYLTGSRKPKGGLRSATLLCEEPVSALKKALERGTVVGESITLARDLVNMPPNDLNPPALADVAKRECEKRGISCRVLNKKQIEKEGMHLLLAVNRGSSVEPRFIEMHYRPAKGKPRRKVVFVGKGLTFDAGGLCIKPAKSMLDMKCDMAGAAVTLGVVLAAARLKLPIEVYGLIGATENMTGANAYRPGDIFPSLDGKTVEIINTDAEGRLVLADVLAWARRLKPDVLVDHATLTGACMVALGSWRAGLFGNDDDLVDAYELSARQAGESFWRLPLSEELRDGLKSDVADLKHTGETYGGAISAALFLREFIGSCKWIHLDIAGPAMQDRPRGLHPKGGTGFGVATAVRFLESLTDETDTPPKS